MYACFDLGGTSLKYGLLDEKGKIISKGKIKICGEVDFIMNLIAS